MRVPRVITGAAALLLAAACSDAITPTRAPERAPAVRPNASISGGVLVRSQLPAGRCMEVNGGTETASAGLPIAIWDCHGGDNQRWTLPATGTTGEIRAYDMCLDAWGGQGNDGDALVIWPCHGGPNQQWTVTAEGEIRAFNGKCADVWFALDENGATLRLYGCHGGPNQRWQLPTATEPVDAGATIIAAGDIANCNRTGDEATAALVDGMAGTVVPLGDLVYGDASTQDFASCYQPSWGRHFGRTRPVPGNHEYEMPGAAGYFGYFGAIAGDPGSGYYSYDVGAWHVVALNSGDCNVVACNATSAQVQWLRADLAAHPRTCTLAVWHHPRFNSGTSHGNRGGMRYFWNALYEYGADVILNGHEHVYERFGPQDPSAAPDAARGIRQFTVGTGGASPSSFADVPQPNSEVRIAGIYGVLRLDLRATSYRWEFVGTDGVVRDAGEQGCH